ncbi:MAG: hypothetical protein ACLP59_22070 [Bryobacteraceae bacterium]
MSKHERLRRRILESQRCNPSGCIHYGASQLSTEFGIPESEVREILIEMYEGGLIRLAAWNWQQAEEREFRDWPDAEAFFTSRDDSGYVRVRVLAPGSELLSKMPKRRIGFVPASH